jgi:class 3 adenylate cyclase
MAGIDEALLDEKLAELEQVRAWSPRLVAKLEQLLHTPDDAALVRMNPLAFARERGVLPAEAIDLFLYAARAGILTMDWHLLCPGCGAAVETFASLRALHCGFFCSMCQIKTDANLDDYIQVSFGVAPRIRPVPFHDLAALSVEDYLYKLRFSREARLELPGRPLVADMIREAVQVLVWLEPGERRAFAIDVIPGWVMACEFQGHAGTLFGVAEAGAGDVAVVITDDAMIATPPEVRPGRVTGTVENRRASRLAFAIAVTPPHETKPALTLEPFLTGAMLLTNQTFRRLFRSETVQGSEGIGVRDVTLLFTDLKGSTALYERIGDLKAFSIVQAHFERLGAVVQRHAGAIIKTIGDAVMAAFHRPDDAVRAALEMQQQIDRFNQEQGSRDVVLKIGVHRGPSIVVTLNDSLDYFGHTVNVAARVQGLADADEIFVTDDVYRAEGVAALLSGVESQDAQLRGIQREVRVHKATRAA